MTVFSRFCSKLVWLALPLSLVLTPLVGSTEEPAAVLNLRSIDDPFGGSSAPSTGIDDPFGGSTPPSTGIDDPFGGSTPPSTGGEVTDGEGQTCPGGPGTCGTCGGGGGGGSCGGNNNNNQNRLVGATQGQLLAKLLQYMGAAGGGALGGGGAFQGMCVAVCQAAFSGQGQGGAGGAGGGGCGAGGSCGGGGGIGGGGCGAGGTCPGAGGGGAGGSPVCSGNSCSVSFSGNFPGCVNGQCTVTATKSELEAHGYSDMEARFAGLGGGQGGGQGGGAGICNLICAAGQLAGGNNNNQDNPTPAPTNSPTPTPTPPPADYQFNSFTSAPGGNYGSAPGLLPVANKHAGSIKNDGTETKCLAANGCTPEVKGIGSLFD